MKHSMVDGLLHRTKPVRDFVTKSVRSVTYSLQPLGSNITGTGNGTVPSRGESDGVRIFRAILRKRKRGALSGAPSFVSFTSGSGGGGYRTQLSNQLLRKRLAHSTHHAILAIPPFVPPSHEVHPLQHAHAFRYRDKAGIGGERRNARLDSVDSDAPATPAPYPPGVRPSPRCPRRRWPSTSGVSGSRAPSRHCTRWPARSSVSIRRQGHATVDCRHCREDQAAGEQERATGWIRLGALAVGG